MPGPDDGSAFDVNSLTDIQRHAAFGSLRWYFNTSHALRLLFERQFLPTGTVKEQEAHILANIEAVGGLFTHWFAALYVVVEAWTDLRIRDARIATLLDERRKVDLLRRFRNWVFHFQPERDSAKFTQFMGESDKARSARDWADRLDQAFLEFFLYCDANKVAVVRWASLREPPRDASA